MFVYQPTLNMLELKKKSVLNMLLVRNQKEYDVIEDLLQYKSLVIVLVKQRHNFVWVCITIVIIVTCLLT